MKKIIFSLLAAAIAITGSAFTNSKTVDLKNNKRTIPPGYFVQTGSDSYTYVTTAQGNAGQCVTLTVRYCMYTVPTSNSVPTTGPYNQAQLTSFGLSPAGSAVMIWHPAP